MGQLIKDPFFTLFESVGSLEVISDLVVKTVNVEALMGV